MKTHVSMAAVLLLTASLGSARAQNAAFDVVSIRPTPAGETFHVGLVASGFESIAQPLGLVLVTAFFPTVHNGKERVLNAPNWLWEEHFNFVGKIAAADSDEWGKNRYLWNPVRPNTALQARLQAALADRCKLVVHRVPAQIAGYALVVAHNGPRKLTPTPADEVFPTGSVPLPSEGAHVPFRQGDPEPALRFYGANMASLAAFFSRFNGLIEDRTGLTGKYDFALPKLSNEQDPALGWDFGALGLKLEPIKIPSENIVIDHIEKPSEN